MAKKAASKRAQPAPTFHLGDWVEIRHFGQGKIVELRGPLGPNGEQVYRVRFRRKPPGYMEVWSDLIRPAMPPKPVAIKNARVAKAVPGVEAEVGG